MLCSFTYHLMKQLRSCANHWSCWRKNLNLHQLQSSAQADSDTADGNIRPTTLQDTAAQGAYIWCQTHPVVLIQSPLIVEMKVLLQLLPKGNLSSVLSASLVFLVCLFLGECWSKPLSWKFFRTFIQDWETCASLCTSPSTQMWLQFKLTPSVPCS